MDERERILRDLETFTQRRAYLRGVHDGQRGLPIRGYWLCGDPVSSYRYLSGYQRGLRLRLLLN